MSNPERKYGAYLPPIKMLHREFLPRRNALAQSLNPIPKETLEINAQTALDSAQIHITSLTFKNRLKDSELYSATIDPQKLSILLVESYARGLFTSGVRGLMKQKNYAFVQAMDILNGIITVTSDFLDAYKDKNISPEDIKSKKIKILHNLPRNVLDRFLNELIEEHVLINEDSSGFKLIDYLVASTIKRSQTDTTDTPSFTLSPNFPIVGAQIAEKIYKASFPTLDRYSPLSK